MIQDKFCDFNIHKTISFTEFTVGTFIDISFDFKQGKLGTDFQKNGYRAQIFTESSVVFNQGGEDKSQKIVDDISDTEPPEFGYFQKISINGIYAISRTAQDHLSRNRISGVMITEYEKKHEQCRSKKTTYFIAPNFFGNRPGLLPHGSRSRIAVV